MVTDKNNLVSPPQIKYYPCAIYECEDDLESPADQVSSQSTISKANCYGVIMALTKVIGESLSDGSIVRIDSLGLFQITVQGLPGESPDKSGKTTIKGANMIYKPSKNMKKILTGLLYKRIR